MIFLAHRLSFSCFILSFILNNAAFSQSLSINYNIGQTIKNNPVFPPLISYSQGLTFIYKPQADFTQQWQRIYPRAQLIHSLSIQSLGNNRILGYAFGGLSGLDFSIYQHKKNNISCQLQLGLAFLNRHYDSFRNPQNVVIGSLINAFGKVEFIYTHQLAKNLKLNTALSVAHYSNAGVQSPNLGINISSLSAGLTYQFKPQTQKLAENNEIDTNKKINYNPKYRPFAQFGLGFSSIASRGAKFPIYTLFVGLTKQFSNKNCVSAGFEWVYNSATFELYNHISNNNLSRQSVYRYSFMLQHEFIFSHISLVTAGGLYINQHIAQRSIFSTKIGLNYYPRALWKTKSLQPFIGVQVRAYFGEAEFAEIATGMKF